MKSIIRIISMFLTVVMLISSVVWLKNLIENWNDTNDVTRNKPTSYAIDHSSINTSPASLGQTIKYTAVNYSGLGTVDLSEYLETGKHYELFTVSNIDADVEEDYSHYIAFDWDGTAKTFGSFVLSADGELSVTEGATMDSFGGVVPVTFNAVMLLEGTPVPMPYQLVSDNVPNCTSITGFDSFRYHYGFYFVKVLLWNSITETLSEDYLLTCHNTNTYCGMSVNNGFTYEQGVFSTSSPLSIVGFYILHVV